MTSDESNAPTAQPAGGSRQAILDAARELFSTRGYGQVTIRDIAALAGTSPALVMKCGGSKQDLYQATARIVPPPLPDVPDERLGHALVNELLERHQRGDLEHLARGLMLRLTAPDPETVRNHFLHGYVDPLANRLRGPDARLRAELVVAALSGLAATIRIFETPSSVTEPERVLTVYGNLVQQLIGDDTSTTA